MELVKVFYRHYRYPETVVETKNKPLLRYKRGGKHRSTWTPATHGGYTECVAVLKFGDSLYEISAHAKCNECDRFEYAVGRKLAYARLTHLINHLFALRRLTEDFVSAKIIERFIKEGSPEDTSETDRGEARNASF